MSDYEELYEDYTKLYDEYLEVRIQLLKALSVMIEVVHNPSRETYNEGSNIINDIVNHNNITDTIQLGRVMDACVKIQEERRLLRFEFMEGVH